MKNRIKKFVSNECDIAEEQKKIRQYGWVAHLVTDADPQSPTGFNYHTHGFDITYPSAFDIQIVVPLPPTVAHYIAWAYSRVLREGTLIKDGDRSDRIIHGYEVLFKLARETDRDVLRVIIPDKHGYLEKKKMDKNFAKQWSLLATFLLALSLSAVAGETEEKLSDGVAKYSLNAAGEKDGKYAEFYLDGKKRELSTYKAGKLHGLRQRWDEKGVLVVEETWRDGVVLYPKSQALILRKLAEFEAEAKKPYSANPIKSADGVLLPSLRDRAVILSRLNTYRYLCDVATLEMSEELVELCQCATDVMSKNRVLSARPDRPDGITDEFYEKALKGADLSNIGSGNSFTDFIDIGIRSATPNTIAATRRTLLNPLTRNTGFGMKGTFMAIYTREESGEAPDMPGVCFPPRGYCPVKLITTDTPWHFSPFPLKEVINETCTAKVFLLDRNMKRVGAAVANTSHRVHTATTFAHTCAIVFKPKVEIKPGSSFEVEIVGVSENPITYVVSFF